MKDKQPIDMEFIYSEGCPDCTTAKKIVENVKHDFDNLRISYFEVQEHPEKIDEYEITHVPTIVIDKKIEFIETLTEKKLKNRLKEIEDE